MKKNLSLCLCLLICVSLLCACNNTSNESSSAASANESSANASATNESSAADSGETSTDTGEKTVVTVWHMNGEDEETTFRTNRLNTWAEEFNETNTDNIEVTISAAKTADVIATTVASDSTPDIFQNYWNNASSWADKGALYDLTDYVNNDAEFDKSDFVEATWGLCTYNDKIYSIPYTISSTFMFYDKDALAEAGWDEFPKTMAELAQCIDDLTTVESDGTITRLGLIPDYPWLDNVLWPAAFGAEWIDEATNTITFDSEEMIAAYQFQADIYEKYGYDEITRFKDSLGARTTTEDPLFTGKLAIRWSDDSSVAAMVEMAGETNTNMGIALMPAASEGEENHSMLTCGVWQVNAKTANPDATWKVLKNLAGAENMAYLAEGDYNNGAFMPRTSALNALLEMDVSDEAKEIAEMLRDTDLVHFPMSSYIGEYLDEISNYMSEAVIGNTNVEDAVKDVVSVIQPLADSAGE